MDCTLDRAQLGGYWTSVARRHAPDLAMSFRFQTMPTPPKAGRKNIMTSPRILVVDDQRAIREELVYALDFDGFRCAEAAEGKSALALLEKGDVHLVLLDIKMPGMDGLEVLAKIREHWPEIPVVMISGHGDIETAVVAIKQGAYDFLAKPFDTDRVLVSIKNGLNHHVLSSENKQLRKELADRHQILGQSEEIEHVRSLISKVAPTEASVLVTGENGTGKELVARQIHSLSRRSQKPFVALNCAAIPADLIESELFGHEKGAFTGANSARRGHFEAADGGTLFLDEIGDLAGPAQAKLLRALQEGEITRLGGSEVTRVNVRIVAATNQDLQAMVAEKSFREDLYYRLHVIGIPVPALRERRADIAGLSQHFLAEACKRNGISARTLAADGQSFLEAQSWPGNVRELRNILEAAAILSDDAKIGRDTLDRVAATTMSSNDGDYFALDTLEAFRAQTEKEFIRRKLQENRGNIKRTAERIKIQRSNLYKKLDRYGLK